MRLSNADRNPDGYAVINNRLKALQFRYVS